ncbi:MULTISPECIES: FmdB family zinc ribbon protein [Streptomyces]|uniref:Zinc ribbon domain-containing protein n=1 Tax=Streptomyces flaveolus TaxID=67297 RepID=A0ABV3AQN8_9ACTN|nr:MULTISPECIES: zinc ribbon domain-containing protein [Streptomyces]KOG59451.1 FmdB family transcriptional regulator [Streptomyces antibioticus]
MAIYELACAAGHRFEVIQSFTAPLPSCPECSGDTRKIPSSFAIGGVATVPPPPERMPQTWKGTYRGDRDYITTLRHMAEARQKLEDKHPELAGDRRPVIAHEGSYEAAPLRVGDALPAPTGTPGHSHSHTHPHGHAHSHGRGSEASQH